jgi:class 3 adenylate cyclase
MALPSGTVTFVFTDIEGSTRLLQQLGDRYGEVVAAHRAIVRAAFAAAGGQEVDTQGDAFFFSFARARDAVTAAVEANRALGAHEWPDGTAVRVRIGLHTGEPAVGDEGYHGLDVVRAARICQAGHGGQILLSETTRALLGSRLPEGVGIKDLGEQRLKDLEHPERVYQLVVDDAAFPALKTAAPPATLAEEIQDRVRQQIMHSLDTELAGKKKPENVLGDLVQLVALVAAIVVIVLLLKLVL